MDLSAFPARVVLRWELSVRAALAVSVPLLVGYWRGGGTSGLLAAIVSANIAIAYLGPDLGIFRWSVFAAVGTPIAILIGVSVTGPPHIGSAVYMLLLFTGFGAMMMAGLTSQLAFNPIAITGLISTTLLQGPVTATMVVHVVLGAVWSLALIAVLPRWRGWPRIPVPAGALAPNTALLRRMLRHPRRRDWAFPLLLGVLAVAVVVLAATIGGSSRPYWATIALIAVLGPNRQQTVAEGSHYMAAAFIGVAAALALLALPLPTVVAIVLVVAIGALGALVLLLRPLLAKASITFLVVSLVSLLAGLDSSLVGGERFMATALGVAVGVLAAGAGEFLASRIEDESTSVEGSPTT